MASAKKANAAVTAVDPLAAMEARLNADRASLVDAISKLEQSIGQHREALVRTDGWIATIAAIRAQSIKDIQNG